ncbi:Uncharacterized protein TCM_013690 [Theobroma cacao]|uniref:Uncharacterized protein n=1 Tax=Theobroma cacao TaxID=3641 RepID=A0A061FXB2_THECC|nr:Uncharacterized protein TCM_013690 [Theobroma cacao]
MLLCFDHAFFYRTPNKWRRLRQRPNMVEKHRSIHFRQHSTKIQPDLALNGQIWWREAQDLVLPDQIPWLDLALYGQIQPRGSTDLVS